MEHFYFQAPTTWYTIGTSTDKDTLDESHYFLLWEYSIAENYQFNFKKEAILYSQREKSGKWFTN